MNLYIMRDATNVYLAYQWSHLPDNHTTSPMVKSANRYGLLMAFDFDNNGKFEDRDNVVNTIDDGLGLAYLGFDVRIYLVLCPFGKCSVWLDIFIPEGLYAFSWNSTEGAQVIGGPTPPIHYTDPEGKLPPADYNGLTGPGPLAPDGTPVSFPNRAVYTPTDDSPTVTHTYTIELAVPKTLFHSPAGFGFTLAQETSRSTVNGDEDVWPLWTWPSQLDTFDEDPNQSLQNPDLAKLLGFLADNMNDPTAILDPGPTSEAPVGGVTTAADRVTLILPWLASCTMLGAVTAAWIARKSKT
jgi:hypothetical protein